MRDSRIYDYFLLLVSRVGLTIYMNDESNQYALLTKIFVESFAFNNSMSRPTVSLKSIISLLLCPCQNFMAS
jgi:hypothetical protein